MNDGCTLGIQRRVNLAEPVTHYEVRLSRTEDGVPSISIRLLHKHAAPVTFA